MPNGLIGGGKALATEISEDVSAVKETSSNNYSSNNYSKTSETSVSLTDDSKSAVTILPAQRAFAKAPVTVSITVPEGMVAMYATSETGEDLDSYKGPFQVTKSGTLVKASAFTYSITNGSLILTKSGSAEATYTIVPDQPVFSEESKTFSDAFDVTLSLPTTTDATSKIHYAIDKKATAESPVYEGPVTISANSIGEEVVLHAVVVDEYGNVGEEKTCTYTFDKPVSLTFKAQDTDGSYYATFSASHDVVFPTDATVYAVSVKDGKTVKTALSTGSYDVYNGSGAVIAVEGYYVPANTGVLLMSNGNKSPYYFVKAVQAVTLPANQLKPAVNGGVFEAEEGYRYYKLAYDDYDAKTDLGFYWGADNGGAFSAKAGTAYLAVPMIENQNAKGYSLNSETTGINSLAANSNPSKAVYNMSGQRVENMQQTGLYIVNGKKVVIRK